ncbi:MAG: hypothetical protein IMX01_07365 [Limnochordaceae bacterium]|nr:hypothetical protein [Limnochordaceae bacterium]
MFEKNPSLGRVATPSGRNRRGRRLGLWTIAGLILTILGVAFWYTNSLVSQMVWVHIPPSKATLADYGLAAEEVYFRTVDGLRISAWFMPVQTDA